MSLKLLFDEKTKRFFTSDQSTIDILRNGYIGMREGQRLNLSIEEGLYLIDARNAECSSVQSGNKLSFNKIAGMFSDEKKFIARYFTYKDWKDKGLIITAPAGLSGEKGNSVKKYPALQFKMKPGCASSTFFPEDLIAVIDNGDFGKQLYEEGWFGQYGTYKTESRGTLNKLDIYETIFLIDHAKLKLSNSTRTSAIAAATERRNDFQKLYDVYSDWRSKGYVIKTGFKFGTHFRLYFPGALPINSGKERVHSKHVIQVFPRDAKLLTSEWARAIRVAHSVRKTFILAIPGRSRTKNIDIDFVLYHRKRGEIELPENDPPSYAMLSLGEDEYIGGSELSAAIKEARRRKLELLIAIADRETAVTYYKVMGIELPKTRYEYYEIDWMQP